MNARVSGTLSFRRRKITRSEVRASTGSLDPTRKATRGSSHSQSRQYHDLRDDVGHDSTREGSDIFSGTDTLFVSTSALNDLDHVMEHLDSQLNVFFPWTGTVTYTADPVMERAQPCHIRLASK